MPPYVGIPRVYRVVYVSYVGIPRVYRVVYASLCVYNRDNEAQRALPAPVCLKLIMKRREPSLLPCV